MGQWFSKRWFRSTRSHAQERDGSERYIQELAELSSCLNSLTEETIASMPDDDFLHALQMKLVQLDGMRKYLAQNKTAENYQVLQDLLDSVQPKCKEYMENIKLRKERLEQRKQLEASRVSLSNGRGLAKNSGVSDFKSDVEETVCNETENSDVEDIKMAISKKPESNPDSTPTRESISFSSFTEARMYSLRAEGGDNEFDVGGEWESSTVDSNYFSIAGSMISDEIDVLAKNELLLGMVNCCICANVFFDPRVLPCGHTFCFDCLDQLMYIKLPGDKMSCPECTKTFKVPIMGAEEITKNLFIRDLCERLDVKRVKETPAKRKTSESSSTEAKNSTPLSKLELDHVKTLKISPGKRVIGVTLMKNCIYIINEWSSCIEVFDKDTFNRFESLCHSVLKWPRDITSSAGCLFIIDDNKASNCIWKIFLSNKNPVKLLTSVQEPYSLSTTLEEHILLLKPSASTRYWHLEVYGTEETDAKPIQSILLSSQVKLPKHAVQMRNGKFVICYGTGSKKEDGHWSIWTVSQVSPKGEILQTLSSVTFTGPLYYLAVNKNDEIFVSEGRTKQVICSDFQFQKAKILANTSYISTWEPWKICFSKENKLLLIGHSTSIVNVFQQEQYV